MRFQTHLAFAKGPIDPAPMVDIVFLLLIFLVLSSPLVLQPGIGMVDLPSSPVRGVESFQEMVVTITPANLLFFNNQPITLEKLQQALAAAAKESRSRELIIKADRRVPHGMVTKVIGLAFESGITGVNVATRPEMPVRPLEP